MCQKIIKEEKEIKLMHFVIFINCMYVFTLFIVSVYKYFFFEYLSVDYC